MSIGKVYLIGAGPGDPELITLKALKVLKLAEVVLVDDLVNPDLLTHCPNARIVQVGKRGGCQSTPQHFINKMMVALAQQGQIVVRLKGGDPFLFGRGGEEMLALRAAGVAYEVIPGVTSGLAAATSLEVPLTHRDYTHGVSFITGHTQDEEPIAWQAHVHSKNTLVIYMGMRHLPEISSALLNAGMHSNTPVMIVEKGTQEAERSIVATLGTLAWAAHQHQMQSPSIIVVGDVVRLANHEKLLKDTSLNTNAIDQIACVA